MNWRRCRRSETRALLPSCWLDYFKLQPNMTAHARNSRLQRTSPQSCHDRSELACDGYHHRPSNGDPVIDALIVLRIIVPADSADVFEEASGGPHTSTAVVCKCCDEIIANRVCVCSRSFLPCSMSRALTPNWCFNAMRFSNLLQCPARVSEACLFWPAPPRQNAQSRHFPICGWFLAEG